MTIRSLHGSGLLEMYAPLFDVVAKSKPVPDYVSLRRGSLIFWTRIESGLALWVSVASEERAKMITKHSHGPVLFEKYKPQKHVPRTLSQHLHMFPDVDNLQRRTREPMAGRPCTYKYPCETHAKSNVFFYNSVVFETPALSIHGLWKTENGTIHVRLRWKSERKAITDHVWVLCASFKIYLALPVFSKSPQSLLRKVLFK